MIALGLPETYVTVFLPLSAPSTESFGNKHFGSPVFLEEVTLDKPRYIGIAKYKIVFFPKWFTLGATVLNLAKTIMYDYHYNFIMKKFPTARLLFTDTDSLCYHIDTEADLYEEIKVDQLTKKMLSKTFI